MTSAKPQTKTPDIVIIGAGIAGLWNFNRLKSMGYDVLLLERDAIGTGQTLASQGIIHSGLKYAIAGQINALAKSISAMPDRWRACLDGTGEINLSSAQDALRSQYMMIPSGFMGGLIKLVSQKALGGQICEIPSKEWPQDIKNTNFKGTLIHMDEPVLNIPEIIRALSEPYKDSIRKIDDTPKAFLNKHNITPKCIIYTAASSNHEIAKAQNHSEGLKTQKRPLLMGMLKPAPFHLNAHLIGTSEKPIATITTHKAADGDLVWYLGGQVAEREKDVNPQDTYDAIKTALSKYLPKLDISALTWSTLPIDRVEGQSGTTGFMPDTPTIHAVENNLYCWPTKLTFAPMLSDLVIEELKARNITPSEHTSDYSDLEGVDYAAPPWDKASWN